MVELSRTSSPKNSSKEKVVSPPPEPIWRNEQKRSNARLIQIVAIAGNVRPTKKAVERARQQCPGWAKAFDKVVKTLIPNLYPKRQEGKIFYDVLNPANRAMESDVESHALMFVDAGDAVMLIAKKYGTVGMPQGFRDLYDHHLAQREMHLVAAADTTVKATSTDDEKKPKKSQAKAIEAKHDQRLLTLFFAVVQGELGWVGGSHHARNVVLEKVRVYVDALQTSSYGLSKEKIEELLDVAASRAPLVSPLVDNGKPSESS